MIKDSVQQEIITAVNINVPNTDTLKYTKQILADIKEVIDSNAIVVGEVKTPLKLMERSSRQKINNVFE